MLDDFQELQRRVQRAQQERDEARGALAQLHHRFVEEFFCEDVAAARARLKKLQKKELQLAEDYTAAKEAFEKKWADVLKPGPKPSPEEVERNLQKVNKFYQRGK